jgi:YHS domain-containing protein
MNWKKLAIGVVAVAVLGFAGFHGYLYSIKVYATEPVYQTSRGALDGYDPVAYFNESKPAQGKPEFTHQWNGADWHFASAENLAAFQAEPERYAPQFGGYCAYAVASGYTAKTSPDAWHIDSGKLYLNYDTSVQAKWEEGKQEFIKTGEQNWPGVIQD